MILAGEDIERARALVAGRLGLDFPAGRQADLERGLLRAARAARAGTPGEYLARLETLPGEDSEWGRLAEHLTVGETYFFRDRACFDALEQCVLPPLIAARRAHGTLRLRLWSAGCATGAEPYSLAILLDRLLPDAADWAVTVLATDLNRGALEEARRGRYGSWALRDTPAWVRDRYFVPRSPESFELAPRIRQMVTFAPLNLAGEAYPSMVTNTSAMDLILCRNVLMYFAPHVQRAAAGRLGRALAGGGWLVPSPAEASADLFRPLRPVNLPGAIFFRRAHCRAAGVKAEEAPAAAAGLEGHATVEERAAGPAPPPTDEPGGTAPMAPDELHRARRLADQGHLEEARRLCQAALRRNPLALEGHLLLAAICQEQGEIPAALEALGRALYLDPACALGHFLLGNLLLRQGQRQRGWRSMGTAVDLLASVAPDKPVPGSGGLAAGRLLEAARASLSAGWGLSESRARAPSAIGPVPAGSPAAPLPRAGHRHQP